MRFLEQEMIQLCKAEYEYRTLCAPIMSDYEFEKMEKTILQAAGYDSFEGTFSEDSPVDKEFRKLLDSVGEVRADWYESRFVTPTGSTS